MLDPAAAGAVDREAQSVRGQRRGRHQRAGVQHHAQARVAQLHVEVVGGLGAVALLGQVGVHRQRCAEQLHGLVDQVRAQVVPQAAAGAGAVAPAIGHLRAEPVEVRVQFGDFAQRAAIEQGAQREEVGVPAAVVEHAEHAAGCRGRVDHGLRLGRVEGERLVDHDMLAGGQRSQRKRRVGVVRGGHDDEVDRRIGEGARGIGDDMGVRMGGVNLGRIARYDSVQAQPGRARHEWCVEDAAGQAEAEQCDVQFAGHGCTCVAWRRRVAHYTREPRARASAAHGAECCTTFTRGFTVAARCAADTRPTPHGTVPYQEDPCARASRSSPPP